MNVSEYVVRFLADHGVEDVFMVSGGGIMYLVDALGRAGIPRYWCNYHEQASAIAAEGYARISGTPGVCLVTSGPGATNALSAIAGAWVDSIPVLVLSGQVRRDLIADYSRWRQFGPQEIDIVAMATPVTKMAVEVQAAADVPATLEAAWKAATSGRPGPVWISLPLDVQGADLANAPSLVPTTDPHQTAPVDADLIQNVIGRLRAARRPVIVAGNGLHLARAEKQFGDLVRRLRLPVVTTIGGMDLLSEDHPYFAGRFGPTGQRRANFTLQNADLLLCLATGLSVAAIGFDTEGFAPRASKIIVNIDREEMARPHVHADLTIPLDVGTFMAELLACLDGETVEHEEWTSLWRAWKSKYVIVTDDYLLDREHVNTYYFASVLSTVLGSEDVVLTGNSLDAHSIFHSFAITAGQRVITNVNFGAMGWDVPALVGASVARAGRRTILVTGDGSILFNSQELLTIGSHKLDVVIFVANNAGYQSIRSTQGRFGEGRLFGSDFSSGIANPSFRDLAAANGLNHRVLRSNREVDEHLAEVLGEDGPTLCELNVAYDQDRRPRVMSRRLPDGTMVSGSLHDQYPFLPREELAAVMRASSDG